MQVLLFAQAEYCRPGSSSSVPPPLSSSSEAPVPPSSSSEAPTPASSSSGTPVVSSSSYTVTCSVSSTGTVGVGVPVPTYSCGTGVTASGAKFRYTQVGGGALSDTPPSWNTGAANSFASAGTREVYLSEVICNGETSIYDPTGANKKSCGSINIVAASSSSSTPPPAESSSSYTVTCTAPSGTPSGTGNYNTGVSVPVPTATCNGSSASAKFTVTDADDGRISITDDGIPPPLNWNKSTPTGHIFYVASDNRAIYLWEVSCGGNKITYGDSTSKEGLIKCTGSISIKSSSSSSATLTCTMSATTGTVGTPITPVPTVKCNDTEEVTSGLVWTPANLTPTSTGTTVAVSVSASSGTCSGKTASCGTVNVSAAPVTYTLTCGTVPTSGIVGKAITPPTVTCTGSNSSSSTVTGLNWTNAPTWANPTTATAYSSVSVSASSGNCSGKTAACSGTLTVLTAPTISSCTGTASETVTLPTVPTTPSVILTDTDNVCATKAYTWTVSKSSSSSSNATWANLFATAGSYSDYKVTTVCGSNAYTIPITSCTGSATVAAAPAGCNASTATEAKLNEDISITANSCLKVTCNSGLRLANYGGGTLKVNVSGGCTLSNLTVPNSNGTSVCTSSGVAVIEVADLGGATKIQIGCY